MAAGYEDVPVFAKIRWIQQNIETFLFFAKRNIKFSREQKIRNTREKVQLLLNYDKFSASLAYLTDISNHVNILNMKF